MAKALLFDVGDVMMISNWELLDALEAEIGIEVQGRGPRDPKNDPDWLAFLRGEIDNYGYWDRLAVDGGFADSIDMFKYCGNELSNIFAPDAMAFIAEARAAGIPVGILSNDLVRIGGEQWVAAQPELQGFDPFVDSTILGVRKPAPDGYLKCIAEFGLEPHEIVFLDDTPDCVDGARAVGMIGVHIDPTNRGRGFDLARRLVGLMPPEPAEVVVRQAEAAYNARDLDTVMSLLHPQITIHWNGRKVASGLAEARQFHLDRLGFAGPARDGYRIQKACRASGPETICGEWESSYRRPDGVTVRGVGGEFWTMRYGLILEWHAYHSSEETQ